MTIKDGKLITTTQVETDLNDLSKEELIKLLEDQEKTIERLYRDMATLNTPIGTFRSRKTHD